MFKVSVPDSRIIIKLFTRHPWLKLTALALAIIVWFYVRGEISYP